MTLPADAHPVARQMHEAGLVTPELARQLSAANVDWAKLPALFQAWLAAFLANNPFGGRPPGA